MSRQARKLRETSKPIVAIGLLGLLASPAFAQGTAEQREACAPDAVRLCQDTIPDVDRTTACMKRHEAELTPRCRTVFSDALRNQGGGASQSRRSARVAPRDDDGPSPRYRYLAPNGDEAESPREEDDVERARAAIGRLCDEDRLDPGTCATAGAGLDLAR